jgi:hypothetical protein
MKNKQPTVKDRIKADQDLLLEQLKKTPIVQIACEKTGVGRSTYYRWREEDKEFAKNADDALQEGSLLINDMAESQLLSAVRDKNMTAIIFWLKHHHKAYSNRLEISTVRPQDEILTPEQEQLIQKALAILEENNHETNNP